MHSDAWSYGELKVRLEWLDANNEPQRVTAYLGDLHNRDKLGETYV